LEPEDAALALAGPEHHRPVASPNSTARSRKRVNTAFSSSVGGSPPRPKRKSQAFRGTTRDACQGERRDWRNLGTRPAAQGPLGSVQEPQTVREKQTLPLRLERRTTQGKILMNPNRQSPDEVCDRFAREGGSVLVRLLDRETILIEAGPRGLLFLSSLFRSMVDFSDDGFGLSPRGAGSALFRKGSTKGIYIHRVSEASGLKVRRDRSHPSRRKKK